MEKSNKKILTRVTIPELNVKRVEKIRLKTFGEYWKWYVKKSKLDGKYFLNKSVGKTRIVSPMNPFLFKDMLFNKSMNVLRAETCPEKTTFLVTAKEVKSDVRSYPVLYNLLDLNFGKKSPFDTEMVPMA
jgi:hypothetical protein